MLASSHREQAPRAGQKDDNELLVFEGREQRIGLLQGSAGKRFEDYKPLAKSHEEGRRGGFDPHARVEDMDVDHVDAEVLYGNPGGGGISVKTADPELRFALMQAYNDWLADFCQTHPQRLIGIAEVPHWDTELAIGEAKRARKKGLRGVLIPAIPNQDIDSPSYTDPQYEPLWECLEDLEMPAHMHLGARPLTKGLESQFMVSICVNKMTMAEPITSMIFSGVFERHPGFRLVSVEAGVGWMAFLVPWMDNVFKRHRHHTGSNLRETPSHYFHQHVLGTFIEDAVGVNERHVIGLGNIMWSSDYPHSDSTWPNSLEVVEERFAGVPEDEIEQMVAGNVARLYGL